MGAQGLKLCTLEFINYQALSILIIQQAQMLKAVRIGYMMDHSFRTLNRKISKYFTFDFRNLLVLYLSRFNSCL